MISVRSRDSSGHHTILHEKCGLAGVLAPPGSDAVPIAATMGSELVHRGQDGGGLTAKQIGDAPNSFRAVGAFDSIFQSTSLLQSHDLSGELALAHTRYRTLGSTDDLRFAQPMVVQVGGRTLVGAHNGHIANFKKLLRDLHRTASLLDTAGLFTGSGLPIEPSDSEILLHRLAGADGDSWPQRIANGLRGVEGAFSLVLITDEDELIALRDPWGIRPLSWGSVDGHYLVASETSVLDAHRVTDQVEVAPGEMWVFSSTRSPRRIRYAEAPPKYCDFEDWYFSAPTSIRMGIEVSDVRVRAGAELAEEERRLGREVISADCVVGIPETGRSGAIGFSNGLGVQYIEGIHKGRSTEQSRRTFIVSSELLRRQRGEHKYAPSHSLRGKIIYVVDDSSVRFNTWRILFRNLREYFDVREIHARSVAPKFVRPCVLGVNINDRDELGAIRRKGDRWVVKEDPEIAEEVRADSVAFLSMDGRANLRAAMGEKVEAFCGYCHGDSGPPIDFPLYDPGVQSEGALRWSPLLRPSAPSFLS